MAKKNAKSAPKKKTAAKTTGVTELKAGPYVIPRGKVDCIIRFGSGPALVIPRGKEGCRLTIEEE